MDIDLAGLKAHGAGIGFTQPAFTAYHGLFYMLILQDILGRLCIGQLPHNHMGLQGMACKVARTHLGAAGTLDTAHFSPLQGNRHRNVMFLHKGRLVCHNDITGGGFVTVSAAASSISWHLPIMGPPAIT